MIKICTLRSLITLLFHVLDAFHKYPEFLNDFGIWVFTFLCEILLENTFHSNLALLESLYAIE